MSNIILSCKDLTVDFKSDEGYTQAVRGISFDLAKGETLCIVGESGSGKSVSCKTIMGILPPSAKIRKGSITYGGEDLTKISEEEYHRIRGNKIGMIFQDPLSALNPIIRIGKQITEAMLINKDRLKIRFEDQIINELSSYNHIKSIITKAKLETKSLKNAKSDIKKYKINKLNEIENKCLEKEADLKLKTGDKNIIKKEVLEYKNILLNELKEELNKRLLDAKKEAKINKENYSKIKKEQLPLLKKAREKLNSAKAQAKENNRVFKEEALKIYHQKEKEILEKYPSDKEIDEKIKNAKLEYNNKINTLELEKNQKIDNLKNAHLITRDEITNEVNEILANYDKLEKENYQNIVQPVLDLKEKKRKELENNKFTNYCEKIKYTKAYAKAKAISVMTEVGIPQAKERFKQYPFEFSGGMRQRIVIAIALIANPEILICDEPTTALDVTIQAQILELINKLKKERNLSCIFITHDMGVVAEMADRIAVMYAGKIVEYGTSYDIFYNPKHPYTWALLSSIPDIDSEEKLEAIPGTPPNMNFPPVGDAFALRSKYAMAVDFKQMPPFFKVSDTHYAATWLLDERAPKVEPPKIVTTRIKNSLKKAGVTYEQLTEK